MSLADLFGGLLRRWYVTIPGLLLAIAAAVGVWYVVPPGYERSATQLLLPGAQSMPESSNPLLYLGGLSNAADVLVRAVGSENVIDEVEEKYPGVDIEVSRDGSTAGPIILTTVTARTDAEAVAALDELLARTSSVLEELQAAEGIAVANRISVVPITVDESSVLQQRDRLVAVFAVGLGIAGLTILVAGYVDGILRRRSRRAEAAGDGPLGQTAPSDDPASAQDPPGAQDPANAAADLLSTSIGTAPVSSPSAAAEAAPAAARDARESADAGPLRGS